MGLVTQTNSIIRIFTSTVYTSIYMFVCFFVCFLLLLCINSVCVLTTRVDSYGFERPDGFDYALYEDFYSRYLTVLTRRAMKWSKMMQKSTAVEKSLKGKMWSSQIIANLLYII